MTDSRFPTAASPPLFIDSGDMQERWKERDIYRILDTQAQLGLNFLATWHAWRNDPQRPRQLHYLAIEEMKEAKETMQTGAIAMDPLAGNSALSALKQELLEQWPTVERGFHRILLSDKNVILTLIFDDIARCLPQIDAQIDLFFLHAGNQRLFSPSPIGPICTWMGRLAAPQALILCESDGDAQIATPGLQKAGFQSLPSSSYFKFLFAPRWVAPSRSSITGSDHNKHHVVVIGAGLAGSAACERLTARGWQVSLIERHEDAAQEASGNLAGIFMPQLAKDDPPGVRLSRAAFLFTLRLWQRIGGIGQAFAGEACGVLQLARDTTRSTSAQEVIEQGRWPTEFVRWLDTAAAAALLGDTQCETGGWLFQQGGWAHPGGICAALLAACGPRLLRRFNQHATRLQRIDDQWLVFDAQDNMIAQAAHVILANGMGARDFAQCANLPLHGMRGQVTYIPAERLPTLPLVVCREGYVTRPFDGICSVGASYDNHVDPALRHDSQHENITRLQQILPGIAHTMARMRETRDLPLLGRVGFRCISDDRLPLAGRLPNPERMANFRGDRLRDVPRLPGLYGLLAYASRGLTWAPLAAEIVAAQIAGEPLPIERDLVANLDPARFCLNRHRHQSLHKKDY